ncbi:hypothetical protein WSM22_02440 [Cytophagales bacterium WSM2-2]|nr:hypothetical protein WSM22_02440 [Cytophagales bacterium WSM2-2]
MIHYYCKAPGFLGGSWEKAFACAELMVRLNQAHGLCARGFIYESQGKMDLAKKYYKNSLAIQPDLKEAKESLAHLQH